MICAPTTMADGLCPMSVRHHNGQKNLPPEDQPHLYGFFAPGLAQNWDIFEKKMGHFSAGCPSSKRCWHESHQAKRSVGPRELFSLPLMMSNSTFGHS